MCRVQRCGHLLDDVHSARRAQRALGQQVQQVLAFDEPHVHVQPTVDFTEVMDGYDVRFVERRSRIGFPAESLLKELV